MTTVTVINSRHYYIHCVLYILLALTSQLVYSGVNTKSIPAANSISSDERMRIKFSDAINTYQKSIDKMNSFHLWGIAPSNVIMRGPGKVLLLVKPGKVAPLFNLNKTPSWMMRDSYILIISPNPKGFLLHEEYGDAYLDERHVYLGEQTLTTNALGGKIVCQAFGPTPEAYRQSIAACKKAEQSAQAVKDAMVSQFRQTWDAKVQARPMDGVVYGEYATRCIELYDFIRARDYISKGEIIFKAHFLAVDAVQLSVKSAIAFLNASDVDRGISLTSKALSLNEREVDLRISTGISQLSPQVLEQSTELTKKLATLYIKVLPEYYVGITDISKYKSVISVVAHVHDLLPDDTPVKQQLMEVLNTGKERCDAIMRESGKLYARDGSEILLIPAGEFLMGSTETDISNWLKTHSKEDATWFEEEKPQHKVILDNYYIAKNLVTVAQYQMFCQETGMQMPSVPKWGWHDNHPIVNVSWNEASAYAKWAGGSLPTEAQWEKAARGTDGRIFPWGNTWDSSKCSNGIGKQQGTIFPVGSYPTGASPYGVLDMAGNISQWCSDWYGEKYYKNSPTKNPAGPATGDGRAMRGGGANTWSGNYIGLFRTSFRGECLPDFRYYCYGFRCVYLLPELPEIKTEKPVANNDQPPLSTNPSTNNPPILKPSDYNKTSNLDWKLILDADLRSQTDTGIIDKTVDKDGTITIEYHINDAQADVNSKQKILFTTQWILFSLIKNNYNGNNIILICYAPDRLRKIKTTAFFTDVSKEQAKIAINEKNYLIFANSIGKIIWRDDFSYIRL
jgi:formylglycine-generating enzyme required for sulfatase activity